MRAAHVGDTVRVHFTGRLLDGTVVASSREESDQPLEFTLGRNEVMPGLEEAVEGMLSGEVRSAFVPADRAHGRHRPDLLLAVERERFPTHVDPYDGQQLKMTREGREPQLVTVLATTADLVLLDTNHPLAGKDLTVEVELLEIIPDESEVVC
jgi:peptidylprolyl isomerase